jgi:hypothetical protein
MKTIKDYVSEGIPCVINSMGRCRRTQDNSIVFGNGWVGSIVESIDSPEKYSVAVCDYNGYFNWRLLGEHFKTDDGTVICDTEEQVCEVLEYIKNL